MTRRSLENSGLMSAALVLDILAGRALGWPESPAIGVETPPTAPISSQQPNPPTIGCLSDAPRAISPPVSALAPKSSFSMV
jgi:hypothetical protein